MPCMLCTKLNQKQRKETKVHHIRTGVGMGQRAGHFLCIPLCVECHTGSQGIHGDQGRLIQAKTDELKLLNEVYREVVAMKFENVGTEYAHTTA